MAKMETRTQANVLRDYIVSEIRAEFPEDEPGIRHTNRRNLYLLTIWGRYSLRFKKLDRRRRTRNNPTQLSLDFLLQRPLELFPDLEATTHLNVGYQPGLTLATSSVWITCPDGALLGWEWSLSEPDELTQIVPFAPSRSPMPRVASAARVRPRRRLAKTDDESVE
jgi:hypothetical protein